MTTQAIDIPYLEKDVKVEDWRKSYTAATALLSAEQKLQLFPIYAGKFADEGEKSMIDHCATKTSIKLALDEFETLRDGEPPMLTLVRRYYETTACNANYKSLFFELLHQGKKAKLTFHSIVLRYLSLCPGGQKFFDDNSDVILEEMTEADAIDLYKKFTPKLDKLSKEDTPKTEDGKTEPMYTTYLSEEMPSWAKELKENVENIQKHVYQESSYSDSSNSDEEAMYTNTSKKSHRKVKNKSKCKSCSKPGHLDIDCYVKCIICSGKGHSSKVCPSKTFRKKSKRPS